jgi:hypothetical protein
MLLISKDQAHKSRLEMFDFLILTPKEDEADPFWPVFHEPSRPTVREILASTLNRVLSLDLHAFDFPIFNYHLLNFVRDNIALFRASQGRTQIKWSMKLLISRPIRGTSSVALSSFFRIDAVSS